MELGGGTAAIPVGVWREFGFGGGGAVALVHGGSGVDRPEACPTLRIEQRLREFGGAVRVSAWVIREQRFLMFESPAGRGRIDKQHLSIYNDRAIRSFRHRGLKRLWAAIRVESMPR